MGRARNTKLKTKDVNFYNIHDGITGRQPGFYLDDLERINAEDRRAVTEDREPDYETMGAAAGVPLVPAELLPTPITLTDGSVLTEPFVTLPVSVGDEPDSDSDDENE